MLEKLICATARPWTAPEAFLCGVYTQSSDVYMFGLLIHELLSLREPYDELSDREYEEMMCGRLAPGELPAGTPEDIVGVTAACLDSDPASRPEMGVVQALPERNPIPNPNPTTIS